MRFPSLQVFNAALLAVVLVLASCRKENTLDCFRANGEDVSDTRQPGLFTEVEVFDKMDVTIVNGPVHKVEIIAGKRIVRNITTTIEGNRLLIDNRNTCNFVRGYKRKIRAIVTTPYLAYLKNNGVGPVTFDENFRQDTLVVRIENSGDIHLKGTYNEVRTSSHGNGDIYLEGRSNSFFVYTYGTNFVNAEHWHVRGYAFIHSQSIGDCTVNADSLHTLAYNIENQGNVFYLGEPEAILDFSTPGASGRLIKK